MTIKYWCLTLSLYLFVFEPLSAHGTFDNDRVPFDTPSPIWDNGTGVKNVYTVAIPDDVWEEEGYGDYGCPVCYIGTIDKATGICNNCGKEYGVDFGIGTDLPLPVDEGLWILFGCILVYALLRYYRLVKCLL